MRSVRRLGAVASGGWGLRVARVSLIQEVPERRVWMANLAVVGSVAVNGVAELQSRLLAQTTLRDFADLWPEKFLNVTNGVSPRRFLRLANPRLSGLITARLGDERWLTGLERLRELEAFADNAEFRTATTPSSRPPSTP
jgi:starch phosphorylase